MSPRWQRRLRALPLSAQTAPWNALPTMSPCRLLRIATLAAMVTATRQAFASEPADPVRHPDEHVRRVELDWQALDLGPEVRPGHAAVYGRTLTSADVGSWAEPPGGSYETPIAIAGGDVGLLPRLSLRLVGASGLTTHVSGMIGGFELWLVEPNTPFRVNVLGGFQEELTRARALWTELVVAHDRGPWQVGISLREQFRLGSAAPAPDLLAVAGTSVAAGPYRFGLEYLSGTNGVAARQALVPSVSTKVDQVKIKASSTLGIRGISTTPARVSVTGAF